MTNRYDMLPTLPLDQILPKHTRAAVRSFDAADAAIIRRRLRPRNERLANDELLTPWRPLAVEHLAALRAILTDESCYWTGNPRYRRFPPKPGFALRLAGPADALTILVDLQNP